MCYGLDADNPNEHRVYVQQAGVISRDPGRITNIQMVANAAGTLRIAFRNGIDPNAPIILEVISGQIGTIELHPRALRYTNGLYVENRAGLFDVQVLLWLAYETTRGGLTPIKPGK